MIRGVGIDMIEVDRVAEKISRPTGFREAIFSTHEIGYCEAQPKKAEHYAGRFAAKEAFLKAAAVGLANGYDLKEIEIINDASGKPEIHLHGAWKKEMESVKVHVSISHLATIASAIVILEQ